MNVKAKKTDDFYDDLLNQYKNLNKQNSKNSNQSHRKFFEKLKSQDLENSEYFLDLKNHKSDTDIELIKKHRQLLEIQNFEQKKLEHKQRGKFKRVSNIYNLPDSQKLDNNKNYENSLIANDDTEIPKLEKLARKFLKSSTLKNMSSTNNNLIRNEIKKLTNINENKSKSKRLSFKQPINDLLKNFVNTDSFKKRNSISKSSLRKTSIFNKTDNIQNVRFYKIIIFLISLIKTCFIILLKET